MQDLKDLQNLVKIRGEKADLFRDNFAHEIVAKERDGGLQKATALKKARSYVIILEYLEGKMKYYVDLEPAVEKYVGFGPNLVSRYMNNSVPLMRFTNLQNDPVHAGAGA